MHLFQKMDELRLKEPDTINL